MNLPARVRFFNFFRNIFRFRPFESILRKFTQGKGYDNFFARCLPQNYQYPAGSFRIAKHNGITFRLDISEYMEWVIYFGLIVENRDSLYRLVKKNMSVLDIGTNIGETLLNFALIAGPEGRVTGFEPVDYNYKKCCKNIELNHFKNVEVFRIALSDRKETLSFDESVNFNSGGIFMQRNSQNSSNPVQATTLDDFIKEKHIERVDFIKIDVEGFELNVLKGGRETIGKLKPVLYIEVDDANLRRQGSSAKELELYLREMNYDYKKADANENAAHYDLIAIPFS